MPSSLPLSHAQLQQFKIDGFLVLPGLISRDDIEKLRTLTQTHLAKRVEPFELETDVQYPGAPEATNNVGGNTIRRLLNAYYRDKLFKQFAKHSVVTGATRQILDCEKLLLNPNHHNCVMTKQPEYSSDTLWHRDTRYWNFNNKYLVNAWFALGDEQAENGGMKILPGSHRWDVRQEALDDAQFLIQTHEDNIQRLKTQVNVDLKAGDVLLFSAHCFHAADRNLTNESKYSMVFTYHGENTKPILETKSSGQPTIAI